MRILILGSLTGALIQACVALASSTRRWVVPCFAISPPPSNLFGTAGVAAPGRWGHHSPLPQYRLAKTGVAVAKRRSRKARFWQGDGHGRP